MKKQTTSSNDELEKEKYRLSIIWNRLADKDVHGNIADILPLFHKVGIKEGRTQAISEFKENMLMTKTNHQLGCMLECYQSIIENRIGFEKEAKQLLEIASKLK